MLISSLQHTQGIVGYNLQKTERTRDTEIFFLHSRAKQLPCPKCKSWCTSIVETGRTRDIRGLCVGFKKMIMRVSIRRIRCQACNASHQEPIAFCRDLYARVTKWAARFVLALREEMSIKAVAKFTGLHWDTVKNIEKSWLKKKYKRVRLNDVRYLGIDEVYLGKTLGYITIVRDLISGTVLFVGKGKGGDALKKFRKRLKRKAGQIRAVSMDMSNAYSAWVAEVLPNADIIYDHFHLIKLMNDRMNNLRRCTMNKLGDEQKKELKGKRTILLRNIENLEEDALKQLEKLCNEFADLGIAYVMKECLRNIYRLAMDSSLARMAFEVWCEKAEASGISCLKQMAKTITKRMEGILGFWKHGSLTNASQEGFNNKVGWLTRQAYGYRDEEYLYLKIYDLPDLSTRKGL